MTLTKLIVFSAFCLTKDKGLTFSISTELFTWLLLAAMAVSIAVK